METLEADRSYGQAKTSIHSGYSGYRELGVGGKVVAQSAPLGEGIPTSSRLHRSLFGLSADTAIAKESILKFANSYGRLGTHSEVKVPLTDKDKPKGSEEYSRTNLTRRSVKESKVPDSLTFEREQHDSQGALIAVVGEPISAWESEIVAMRSMIQLWESLKQNKIAELRKVIRWANDGVYYRSDEAKLTFEVTDSASGGPTEERFLFRHDPVLSQVRPDDVVLPGWYYLQQRINDKLGEHKSSPKLLWERHPRLRLAIVPDSLISALWLQFARAVEGDESHRRCDFCRRWFEVGAEVRADAKYCSNSCRQKSYRRNKAGSTY